MTGTTTRREMVNAFPLETVEQLAPREAELVARRLGVLGAMPPLLYRRPVHVVRAEGCYLYDGDGRALLDCLTHVAPAGHANPAVTAAVTAQLGAVSAHSWCLQDGIVAYAERLLDTFPVALDRVTFTNSRSEANDLAVRMARAVTGRTGVVVTANACHGTTLATAGLSPSLGVEPPGWVRTIEVADLLREPGPDAGRELRRRVEAQIADLHRAGHGLAAVLADSMLCSDGTLPAAARSLKPVADAVHAAGGLYIADETQSGYGRTGDAMWGFSRHGLDVDAVTLGEPMSNGLPIGAVVHGDATAQALAAAGGPRSGANPASLAAAAAVLAELTRLDVLEHTRTTGDRLRGELRSLLPADRFQVRGAGLAIAVDCVREADTGAPDPAVALEMVNALRERGVLVSVSGRDGNVLTIQPPLVFSEEDAAVLLDRLDDVVGRFGRPTVQG